MTLLVVSCAVAAGVLVALAVVAARRRGSRSLVSAAVLGLPAAGIGLSLVDRGTALTLFTVAAVVYVVTFVACDVT